MYWGLVVTVSFTFSASSHLDPAVSPGYSRHNFVMGLEFSVRSCSFNYKKIWIFSHPSSSSSLGGNYCAIHYKGLDGWGRTGGRYIRKLVSLSCCYAGLQSWRGHEIIKEKWNSFQSVHVRCDRPELQSTNSFVRDLVLINKFPQFSYYLSE